MNPRALAAAGLLSMMPADAIMPPRPSHVWTVGTERDASPDGATPDMTPEAREEVEEAARAYLEARRRRQEDEERRRHILPPREE